MDANTDLEDDEVVNWYCAGSDGLSKRCQVAVNVVDDVFGSFARKNFFKYSTVIVSVLINRREP